MFRNLDLSLPTPEGYIIVVGTLDTRLTGIMTEITIFSSPSGSMSICSFCTTIELRSE